MASEQQLADGAAAASAGIAGVTWLAQLNEILQLGATAVAIVAGVYAIIWHKTRTDDLKRKMTREDDKFAKKDSEK